MSEVASNPTKRVVQLHDREVGSALLATEIEGKEVLWDPSQLRKIQEHPCFSENACHFFGRMHLPVAPRCNIQCNYCVRKFDCVNESRPGVTSKVLTPEEALERVREVLAKVHYIKVIAVAGPGEPLYNEATFETFRLVKDEFPRLMRCLSTNGLLLPERIDDLEELGIGTVTVTLNAVDPAIGKDIYSFVTYHGKTYKGEEGAAILLKNQLEGIQEAVKRKILIKVNTVLVPTVNDKHIVEIAKEIRTLGVYMHNIIPLIPQYKFAHIKPPTPQEKKAIQEKCREYVKEMTHCRHCRADAIGKLGKDIQAEMFSEK
ncbi:MAG: nitrogenase cofactor biosynthesis protein NifB [Halobacteriota archaeon]